MAKQKILIVEDDKNISKLISYNLEKSGFDCVSTSLGEEALIILDKENIDLAILDIMLPTMDGFEICKAIRKNSKFSNVRIMMLTAKGEEIDKILGFELGADDYIVKPFSPREFILRVKAVLRRSAVTEKKDKILNVDDIIVIDISRHKVLVDKKNVILTPIEFKLLVILIERRGRVQSRDVLLEDVWDIAADVTTRTIDTHVKRLRKKLDKAGKLIETIRSIGYRLKEEEESEE